MMLKVSGKQLYGARQPDTWIKTNVISAKLVNRVLSAKICHDWLEHGRTFQLLSIFKVNPRSVIAL